MRLKDYRRRVLFCLACQQWVRTNHAERCTAGRRRLSRIVPRVLFAAFIAAVLVLPWLAA
jgi:hypothetical protein